MFEGKLPALGEGVYVAPTAAIIGDTSIGDESSVWFGACIRGDYGAVWIGQRCSVQDNAVVHVNHRPDGTVNPTVIHNDCVVGHGAVIEGCEIGTGCLIGMNAVVLPGARVGAGSVVAAGAVVMEGQDVPENTLVAGAPAQVRRRFDGPGTAVIWAANEYVLLRQRYLEQAAVLAEVTK